MVVIKDENVSSTFDKYVDLSIWNEWEKEWFLNSISQWFGDLKDLAKWIGWFVSNEYSTYNNDSIKNGSAFASLEKIVAERERLQDNIMSNDEFSINDREFELEELNKQYKSKENTLLSQAIEWDNKREKFDEYRNDAFKWAWEVSVKEDINWRLSQESRNFIDGVDKVVNDWGLVSNDTLSYKLDIKSELAEELANLEINKVKAVSSLKKNNAEKKAVINTIDDYNEMISIQKLISKYSLEAANDWILDWDLLTDYVIEKLWDNRMKRAVDLKNNMNIDLQRRQANANLWDKDIFMSWVWYLGLWGSVLAKYTKKGLGIYKSDERQFKDDFSWLQLSDESWLMFALKYWVDNFDDIGGSLVWAVSAGWVLNKWVSIWGEALSKVTRLKEILDNTQSWRKFLEWKTLKWANYLKNQLVTWIGANQVINVSMNDVNSEERLVTDAIMDLALWPIFDGVFSSTGYLKDRVTKTVMNSKLIEDFTLTEKRVIENIITTKGLDEWEAKKLFQSTQDYLVKTNNSSKNTDIFKFINDNEQRLKDEWTIVGNGYVTTMRQYQNKAYNPLKVDIKTAIDELRDKWTINLLDNSIVSLNVKDSIKKVRNIYEGKTPELTMKWILYTMGWGLNKKEINSFVENNSKLVNELYQTIINVKAVTKDIWDTITSWDASLKAIQELSDVLWILSEKTWRSYEVYKVYLPVTVDWVTTFNEKIVKKNDLSINWYEVIYNSNWVKSKVFLNNTLKSKIINNELSKSEDTVSLIRRWYIEKSSVDSLETLEFELSSIFWTTVQLNGKWLVSLKESDWNYSIHISKTPLIVSTYKDSLVYYKWTKFTVSESAINKILVNSLLNRTTDFIPGEIDDALTATVIELNRKIKEWVTFDDSLAYLSLDNAHKIATDNVNKILKDVFDEKELITYNKIINETLLTKSAIGKLTTLSDMGSKGTFNAMLNLTEGLMLRVAERFSKPEIKKLIINVMNDVDENLSNVNKADAINNILLWENPINAFKYVWDKSSWHIKKLDATKLWVEPTSKIFTISREDTNTFIKDIIKRKEDLWVASVEEINALRDTLKDTFDNKVEIAKSIYTDTVIRSAMNEKGMNQEIMSKKVIPGKIKDEEDYVTPLLAVIDEWLSPSDTIKKANDIIIKVNNKISSVQYNKIKEVIKYIRTIEAKSKWDDTTSLVNVVTNLNKLSWIISRWFDVDKDKLSSQYSYESQITWGDNILSSSFNHILNPLSSKKIFDKKVAAVIDKFITKNILLNKDFWPVYKGKSIFELVKDFKEPDGTIEAYEKWMTIINNKIREFIYPKVKDFKITANENKLLIKRDLILKSLIKEINDYISKDKYIIVLDKDGKPAVGKRKWDIVTSHLDKWSIINTLQIRLSKKHFEWTKIDFNEWGIVDKIEWIEEHRTMFDHFNNASKTLNIKPLILNWNSKSNTMGMWSRENYRIANNVVQYYWAFLKKYKNINTLKGEIKKYLIFTWVQENKVEKYLKNILYKAQWMVSNKEYVEWYIALMNIWDKDSFWAYMEDPISSTIKGKTKGKEQIVDFTSFMRVNDLLFSKAMVKELNMSKVKNKKWDLDLTKIAKRIASLASESESLVPTSSIVVRNYILDEPTYIDAVLQSDDSIDKDSLFEEALDDKWNRIYETLSLIGKEYILTSYKKELNAFKDWFELKDFDEFNSAIVDLLNTPYSDWVSFLAEEQITFYSKFQSHIEWKNPIKMIHYGQNKEWNVLYKTNFNAYTDEMKAQMTKLTWGWDALARSRLIGAESEKLKTYSKPMTVIEWESITINWISHKIKWYIDTTTSFDRHASSEAETLAEINWITKQIDVRTHPAASEFILRIKQQAIQDTIVSLRETFWLDVKLGTVMFSEFEDFTNYVLDQTDIPGGSLWAVNSFLKDQLKWLKSKIEKPKDEWLGFRSVMQPRINRLEWWKLKLIADDELVVSPEKFAIMKSKMLKVGNDYYVTSYRNPVPNAENITLNKVVIDESMVSLEDVAINPWNVFINKQADYDGDHLNIVYINNPENKWKDAGKLLGWLWATLGSILNTYDVTKVISEERRLLNASIITKIYWTKDALSLEKEIEDFIKGYILEQWDNWIPQTRVPIAQVEKGWATWEAQVDTLVKAIDNSITGKDNIWKVDSFIRTLDLVRKFWWEYNNMELTWKKQIDIEMEFKAWMSDAIDNAGTNEDILYFKEVADKMVKRLSSVYNSEWYKSVSGKLEQMTLDLAHMWLSKLPDNWAEELYDIVFPWLDYYVLDELLVQVSVNTNNVYDLLSDNKVLTYGRKFTQWELTDIELPLFGQHKSIYNDLRNEVSFLYEEAASISRIQADRVFFGYNSKESYRKLADATLSKYIVNDELIALIKDPDSKVPGYLMSQSHSSVPWIEKIRNKSKWYDIVVTDKAKVIAYDKIHKLWLVDKWVIVNATILNKILLNNPFPWVSKKNVNWVYVNYIKDKKALAIFKEATKDIELNWSDILDNGMTKNMYWRMLMYWSATTKTKINQRWLTSIWNKVSKKYTVTFANKFEWIERALNILKIDDASRNPILLKNNMSLDHNYLNKAEQIKLMYTHFILKDSDLKDNINNPDFINKTANRNLLKLIWETSDTNLSKESKEELIALKKSLWSEVYPLKELGFKFLVKTDEALPIVKDINWEVYNIDKKWEWEYIVYKTWAYSEYKPTGDKTVDYVLEDLISEPIKKDINLLKKTWLLMEDIDFMSDKADDIIDTMGRFTKELMSTKVMSIFKDIMLRNVELKNNATYDLYEDFNWVQAKFSTLNKIKRRQIDNHLFMRLYEGKWNVSSEEINLYKKDYDEIDHSYYNAMHELVMKGWEWNEWGQSILKLFRQLDVNLEKSIRKQWGWVANLSTRFTSSLIEDIVNLRHKTEKIWFYEAWIYDRVTFKTEYMKRIKELKIPYNEKDLRNIYNVIFEYDLIQTESIKRSLSLMRNTSYSVSMGAFSWLTHAAWFTMGLMQIPSELLRLWAFSKHSYRIDDLNNLMDDYKILKSTWIEAWIHFWPIEAKPQFTHKAVYKIATLGKVKKGYWWTIAKYVAALAANPLMITDLAVDSSRKRVAIWNMLQMLWFKSVQELTSHLDTMPTNYSADLLNRIRLGAEFKYHELSGGVTGWSYLARESTFARMKQMIPFSFLMNWALHLQATTMGSARQATAWMKELFSWDAQKWMKLIQDSNIFARTLWQSIVVAALYAKLNSYNEYEWDFEDKKDMYWFIRTLNSNILSLEMFYPIKALIKTAEQEGWMEWKIMAWLSAVTGSVFRELDMIWIIWDELTTSTQVPTYDTFDAITTALVTKGTKWLGYSKMISMENQFPEFSRRALIDQMFGSDNPNFDESLYKKLYSESRWERMNALWESGQQFIMFTEVAKSIPIIRHMSAIIDWGTSYNLYDKQVRIINKKLTDGTYDNFYKNPNLLITDIYNNWDISKIWQYTTKYATKWKKTNDWTDKLLQTSLSKFIPEIKYNHYGQLTESIMIWELVNELGVDGYLRWIGTKSEQNQHAKQLLMKINTESPAKLPYVLSILLANDYYEVSNAISDLKWWDALSNTETALLRSQLLKKYEPLIKWNKPLMAQLLGYKVWYENEPLKELMFKDWYLKNQIADRITTRIMMTEAHNKWEDVASYIWTRFASLTNKLTYDFSQWKIEEGLYKTALLDLYRVADDEIQEWNFTADQKLEIRTTLYRWLGKHAYILYEDESLWEAYESSRINMAHRAYAHTSTLSKYASDAQVIATKWDIDNPDLTWTNKARWDRFKTAYRNTNLIRKFSSSKWWAKGKSYSNWFIQWGANNIQRMLGNPRTNFKKIFKPTYNPYSNKKINPFGFRFTVEDKRTYIEYFRLLNRQSQFSKDLFTKDKYLSKSKVSTVQKRRAELTRQYQKNIGRTNFRWFLSKGLMKWLPWSKEG